MIKKTSKLFYKTYTLISVISLFFVTGILIVIFWKNFLPKRTMLEDRKNITKELPPAFKEKIKHVASDSATMRVPILMYHYIEYVQDKKDTIRASLALSPYTFEQQVITLKEANFTFLTARDLGDILDGKTEAPAHPVLLTFDDGYRDFYTDVYPILKKYQVKATAYIAPGLLDRPNYMLKKQLKEISREDPFIEIGAHTVNHRGLKGLFKPFLLYEVNQSKKMLEDELRIPIVSFAYPYGAFDKSAEDAVKEAGYKTSLSTVPGIMVNPANRYFLYRLRPGYRTGESLIKYLNQESFKPW